MRRRKVNTALARQLAVVYAELVGEEFPGGPTNAYIYRTNAGFWQRAVGAWSWYLDSISQTGGENGFTFGQCMGSQWPAKLAVKDRDCLDFQGLISA